MIEPGPVRDHVANWDEVVPALLERARREAVGGVLDQDTAELVERLRSREDVRRLEITAAPTATAPVVDVRFRVDGATYAFFSVISTLGTPVDVTAQELRVEAFFPSDEATRVAWAARA
jgi:hypothetical protein